MIDREKVLKGLECCSKMNGNVCRTECPYRDECIENECVGTAHLCANALELLKEQQKQRFFVDSDGKITPLPIQPQWISVEDRMPPELHSMWFPLYGTSKWKSAMWREESDHVLVTVVFDDGARYVSMGRTHDGEWNTNISKVVHHAVTHWMPLPEPPEEVKWDD